MSGWNPQIADWMRLGLDWQYIDQSTMRIFEIPAKSQFQLPRGEHTFKYPEGVLLHFTGGFDHPLCGIRIESEPEFDTGEFFSVNNIALGLNRPENLTYAMVPPITPPGTYGVRIPSPWVWEKWLRLFLFNADSIPHRVIGHSYHIAVLKEERPKEEG